MPSLLSSIIHPFDLAFPLFHGGTSRDDFIHTVNDNFYLAKRNILLKRAALHPNNEIDTPLVEPATDTKASKDSKTI